VLDEQGTKIVVLDWLKGLHAPDGAIFSRSVWITFARQRIHLRLVALRLSQDQQKKAERRSKHKASKNQKKVHPNTLYLSGWVLVITTLPQQKWSDQQVLRLYQARWHIELFFKRIKQLLKLQRLRCKTAASAKPTITLLLIGWALLEEESAAVRLAMRDAISCTKTTQRGQAFDQRPAPCILVARQSLGSTLRMDVGRSQLRSLLPTTSRQLYSFALSGLSASFTTLFGFWSSRPASSLFSGLSLAWSA
jgi:hypothetical protein